MADRQNEQKGAPWSLEKTVIEKLGDHISRGIGEIAPVDKMSK